MSDVRGAEVTVEYQGALRHPSGWWKARDGKWYRPDQEPAVDSADESGDLVTALSIAVGAIVLGSLAGAHLELTLLIGGIAGALVARWWLFSRDHRGWLTSTAALCAVASAVLTLNVVRTANTTGQLHRSVFIATAGALMAAMMALKLRATPQPA